MKYLTVLTLLLLSACHKQPAPELDPVKVQQVVNYLGTKVEAIEARVAALEKPTKKK